MDRFTALACDLGDADRLGTGLLPGWDRGGPGQAFPTVPRHCSGRTVDGTDSRIQDTGSTPDQGLGRSRWGVPLTLLAMVGPRVIKLCTSRLESVGRSSGSVYAFSTVGSVLGTLVLGFFLLPMMGTRTVLYGVSVGLLVLAAVLALHERARMNTLGLLVLPFVSIGIVGLLLFLRGRPGGEYARLHDGL